ncbi:multicopper oxidase family protein [Kyrpidia tusciae]|uniref:Multicopper oxidase type 3 n=1 Tax=Kyrpidia tusciae (strain DSM 2912 / NBRC 15312 / T2) TaxID=562970 RepID=D5WSH7_KYRT2|nr:multicopper oxidase family protein [Kyrpidia tusciae]ADG05062.1 multicopper oxidase type 3 [Kyrpidia tusciae DSM 2912]
MKGFGRRGWAILTVIVLLVGAGIGWAAYHRGAGPVRSAQDPGVSMSVSTDDQGRPLKTWTIVAKPARWEIAPGVDVQALTYGGTVPGTTIEVRQGDHVRVKLVNQLSVPTSIHWHGYPVPASMDGVPGITQDPVQPGQSFVYDFIATVPGTYWYHSHMDSANQVDEGLYGPLIVLPKTIPPDQKTDRDYTLVLDEWSTMMGGAAQGMMDQGGMGMGHGPGGMGHEGMSGGRDAPTAPQGPVSADQGDPGMSHDQMMKMMYNIYTVNGRSGSMIAPMDVKPGETVRLRFINAGYLTHLVHLQGQPFRVVATDGRATSLSPEVTDRALAIGAGERYDVIFTATHSFAIDLHDGTPAAPRTVIPVRVAGDGNTVAAPDHESVPTLNMTTYENGAGVKDATTWDASYTWHLNSAIVNGQLAYTINGKVWPYTDPIAVKTGDRVKVTLINDGQSDHPMHLHGHVFRVLTRNGVPVQGDVEKDTLLVRPGETYEIGFVADNPGVWVFHCHDLHHAAAGMMSDVEYQDYHSPYPVDKARAGE